MKVVEVVEKDNVGNVLKRVSYVGEAYKGLAEEVEKIADEMAGKFKGVDTENDDEKIRHAIERSTEIDRDLWTKSGEIIKDINGNEYICGTSSGHLYPILYQNSKCSVGIRELITDTGFRVRVQFYSEGDDDEVAAELKEAGLARVKREGETGFHYSRCVKDESVAIDLVKKAIEIVKGD